MVMQIGYFHNHFVISINEAPEDFIDHTVSMFKLYKNLLTLL